ncbi:PAS domain-containing protein [Microvirga sp. 2YAF29]|uniref:PAS domain-containing protein n=1 Tax=Microvirga sp. 2YAF29 TaxID=3233031 RepID=UPI003F9A647D
MTKRDSAPIANDVAPSQKEDKARKGDNKQRVAELERQLGEVDQALRLSTGKLRMALDIGKLGAWERDIASGAMTGTPNFKANLGLPLDAALTYDDFQQMFHPGDVDRINQAISYALRTKTDFQIEHRVMRADGRIGRVLMRGGAVYEDGEPIRLMGVIQDVADREKAKEEANRAQRRQEFLLNLNDQIGNFDDPAQIMEIAARDLSNFLQVDYAGFNEVYEDRGITVVVLEWSKGLFSNQDNVERIDNLPQDLWRDITSGKTIIINDTKTDPRVSNRHMQEMYATANQTRTSINAPILRSEKLIAFAHVGGSQPRAWTGDEIALIEDVAERTWVAVEKARAKRELRETEARFNIIAESLPALVWILNPNTELTYTNERWVKYSGLAPEEALGHSWTLAIHPEDWERMTQELVDVVGNHKPYVTEARYRSSEGEYRWHLIQGEPVHGADGLFKGWVGTSVDIHDLKMTEEALRNSEQQLRLALQAAQMGDWRIDYETDAVFLSDRACEIVGLPPGSPFTRKELNEATYPGDLTRVLSDLDRAVQNHTIFNIEFRIQRRNDYAQVWLAAQGQGTYHPDGTHFGTSGVIQDITDRKHAEERQQLLIRELHHRVKNTLATVQAIVGSTARTAGSIDEFYQGFVGRIVSLARTHNLLTEDLWQKAALEELVQTELGPYKDETRNRIIVEGPHLELPSEAAVPIGMAIHELTTNAAKHGALSTFGGQVEVRWRIELGAELPMLHFTWRENGGPRVMSPARQGFGSRLLQRVLTTQLQAQVRMDFQEDGLNFTMVMPIPGEPPLFNPDK